MKRLAFCLALVLLSMPTIYSQVNNSTKTIHGHFEIQQNGRKLKPALNTKMMVYCLGDRLSFDSTAIELQFKSNHDRTLRVYLIYYDIDGKASYKRSLETGLEAERQYSIPIIQETPDSKEYICLLYSTESFDVKRIVDEMNNTKGTLLQKMELALNGKIVPTEDIRFVMNEIEFSARTDKTVVPVIIEIIHE